MNEITNKYKAPALERGLDILELLSELDEPISKKDMVARLGRSVNELYRMLNILETRGYIATEDKSGKYHLTLKLFELSNKYPPIQRLLNAASTEMADLSEVTQQSCHLSVLHDAMMVVIAVQNSPYKMGFCIRMSARIDVHGSGSGFAMLAFQTPEQRRTILETSNTPEPVIESVLSQMDKVRKQGYFVGASPQISGVTNISYPIFNAKQKVEAVLTMPFLTLNSDSLHHQVVSFEDSRQAVARSAQRLIAAIGGQKPDIYA